MFCFKNYQKIAKYLLLCFLCSASVFSATNATAAAQADGEDAGINVETGTTTRLDLTTTKQYMRIVPTVYPEKQAKELFKESPVTYFFVYALHFAAVGVVFTYICKYIEECIKEYKIKSELLEHSSISSDILTTVHLSSEQSDFVLEVHRPPTGKNQFPSSRSELSYEPLRVDLFNGRGNSRDAADTTGELTSYINYSSANCSHGRGESDDALTDMPPDYATVVLNDFTYPSKPDFPAVKKDRETPPPEYIPLKSTFLDELP